MEGVRSQRPEVLSLHLRHCQRVKVARLCVQWAETARLAGLSLLGSGFR
jgi:hypothetical protein